MSSSQFSRRGFHRLTVAAFGGLLSGTAIGCRRQPPAQVDDTVPPADGLLTETQIMLDEPHVCRGLNTCQGQGAGQQNACAGQGNCATAGPHDCRGMNDCRGQGGCSNTAGRNACQGQGECAVPLKEETWQRARQAFEQAMQAAGRDYGEAPDAG